MATWGAVPPPIAMCEVPPGANVSPEPRPVPLAPDASALLSLVAAALTACETAGIKVRLKHDAVLTDYGYVLPLNGSWAARTREWTEFSSSSADDDD